MDTTVAALFILAGVVYGVFGWRIIGYLAVMDALALSLFLARSLIQSTGRSHLPLSLVIVCSFVVVSLPWLAWRFRRQAVYAMCGFVGFAATQMLFFDDQDPMLARLLLGAVGASLAMALQMTLSKQTAIVVTALHGAWLCVAAMEIMAQSPQTFFHRMFFNLNSTSALLVPFVVLIFAAILTAIQWADLDRSPESC